MSRAALIGLAALLAIAAPAGAASLNPHVDPSLLRAGCAACHAGHGTSRSPMLAHSQKTTRMTCHDTRAGVDQQIARSNLAPNARPPLIGSALLKASAHPISAEAFSSTDGTAVVCTSCHAPHRGAGALAPPGGAGKRRSPRSPTEFEHELCERCHGRSGQAAGRADVARLLDPANRSYHPVEAPASTG